MKRCQQCVLPHCAPGASFNEENICNYCRSFRRSSPHGISALIGIMDSRRKAGCDYDCLVAVSGGRDSIYTLLVLAKDCNKKVIAVHYDNPFSHPLAKENIQKAVKALGVKLVTYRLKNRWHERTLRNNLNAWLKRPHPLMVNMICVACRAMEWKMVKIAKKYHTRCIVGAGTQFEDTAFKKELLHPAAGESYDKAIIFGLPNILREIKGNLAYLNPLSLWFMIRGYAALIGNAFRSRLNDPDVLKFSLFSFIDWDEETILSRIKSELDWNYPREYVSSWRFDCRVGLLKDLMYMRTLGLTEKDDFYSQLVRAGKLSRDEALRRLEKENRLYPEKIELLLREIGINLQFFRKRMSLGCKSG